MSKYHSERQISVVDLNAILRKLRDTEPHSMMELVIFNLKTLKTPKLTRI